MGERGVDPRSYFADKAEAYKTSKSHANQADLDRMIAWLQPKPGARAVDVATGGGHTANALRDAGCRVVSTDMTRQMGPTILADAQRMPLRDATFDIVASRIAPHHFPDLDAFARESARILAPGGKLYVFDLTTPENDAQARVINHVERLRDPSHHESYRASRWREALASFKINSLETTASEFEFEPWVARAGMEETGERELRSLLAAKPDLSGYGLTPEGKMRVLRVEILATTR